MEIKYRGGSYMGRCQGGLPEGKVQLCRPEAFFLGFLLHSANV